MWNCNRIVFTYSLLVFVAIRAILCHQGFLLTVCYIWKLNIVKREREQRSTIGSEVLGPGKIFNHCCREIHPIIYLALQMGTLYETLQVRSSSYHLRRSCQ